jgi:hypothetical protein
MKSDENTGETERSSSRPQNLVSGQIHGTVIQMGSVTIKSLHVHNAPAESHIPRQLPTAPRIFVNRGVQVRKVADALKVARRDKYSPLVVVHGAHGIGKTSLLRMCGTSEAENYPDGQIYVDLALLRRDGDLSLTGVMGSVLRSLGVPDDALKTRLADQLAYYRSLTAGKALLVAVDDVDLASQVHAVMPTSARSAVIVSSRSRLAELGSEDASFVEVGSLTDTHARELVDRLIGEDCVLSDQELDRLVDACAGLPLALSVVGARLAMASGYEQRRFYARVLDSEGRLEALSDGGNGSFGAMLDEAISNFSHEDRSCYGLLGLFPGPTLSVPVVAALWGASEDAAAQRLEDLSRRFLVQPSDDQYVLHDLVKLHARDLGRSFVDGALHRAAIRRVVRYCLDLVRMLDRSLVVSRLRLYSPDYPESVETVERRVAFAIFERERASIVAVLYDAAAMGFDEDVWPIGEALWPLYHAHRYHSEEAVDVFELTSQAAARTNSIAAAARLLAQAARARMDLGDLDGSAEQLRDAAQLQGHHEPVLLSASIREWTGVLETRRGDLNAALVEFDAARSLFEIAGSRRGQTIVDYLSGVATSELGDPRTAVEFLVRARDGVDAGEDGLLRASILHRLGKSLLLVDRPAAGAFEECVELARQNGDVKAEAEYRESFAGYLHGAADVDGTVAQLQLVADLYRSVLDPRSVDIDAQLAELAENHSIEMSEDLPPHRIST